MKLPRRGFLGLAAGATALPALPRFARADPVQIRAAWVAPVESFPSMWLFKKELARHFGKFYVFEPVHFAGTPPMVTAIANNVRVGCRLRKEVEPKGAAIVEESRRLDFRIEFRQKRV